MRPIEFKVRFITPLLIGGAGNNQVDEDGLNGKALRGCWRFWFRAIVGGAIGDNQIVPLKRLEELVFGSTDMGTFRVFVQSASTLSTGSFPRRPHKAGGQRAERTGFAIDSQFAVTILPRSSDYEVEPLLATIWIWGNLGAAGNRSRRGFGSPVIESSGSSKPFEDLNLAVTPQFLTSADIETHLKNGLQEVWTLFSNWLTTKGYTLSGNISTNPFPLNCRYFILNSFNQVAVSRDTALTLTDWDNATIKVHGNRGCEALGFARGNKKRMASPVFTRFHKTATSFIPVATFTEQAGIPTNCAIHTRLSCVTKYLTAAGFTSLLDGSPL